MLPLSAESEINYSNKSELSKENKALLGAS